jgi:hypothetical protein
MKKDNSRRFLHAVPLLWIALAGVLTLGLLGCEEESSPSDAKEIISFSINDKAGSINHTEGTIEFYAAGATNVTALSPEVTVPKTATVTPASGDAVDFTLPVVYRVIAENLTEKTYLVTVIVPPAPPAVTLERISATSLAGEYAYGAALDPTKIVVTGYYSDGTSKTETAAVFTGYDPQKNGYQTVLATLNGKTTTFSVSVGVASTALTLNIGLPNNQEVPLFNVDGTSVVTAGIIKLSHHGNNGLPNSLIISAGQYNNIIWYINNNTALPSTASGNGLLTINAGDYSYGKEHTIVFTGSRTLNGTTTNYSRTIRFTVEF